MLFLLLGLVTGAIGAVPLFLSGKRYLLLGGIYAVIVALATWGLYYSSPPALVNPLWGGVGVFAALAAAVAAGLVVLVNKSDDDRGRASGRSWPAFIVPAIAFALLAGRGCAGCSALRSSDYAGMIGEVEERVWTQDVQPNDPHHIRLVPIELAAWLADKQLGEAPGAVGSQFQIDKERMTIQMVKGELWYVAPLDFEGFAVWNSAGVAPGYIMVSGEDPHRTPVLKMGEKFAYTPAAYFGHNLERHLWTHGYESLGLADYSFEIDEEGKPWWVVTVYEPTIAWSGESIKGVVIVNPTDGSSSFHEMGKVPAWVDRAVPKEFVSKYITWRGKFAGGWWNSVWAEKNITAPQSPSFIHGNDGEPYWVTDISSSNEKDKSLLGLMYTNARSGKSVFYRAVGSVDEAVLEAVNNKVAYRRWHGASPVLYNMYGTMASIVPLLGESHTFQGVAIVKIDNASEVAIGDDLAGALREYQKMLGSHGVSSTPEIAHNRKTVEGKVDRFAIDVRGQETTYYVHLKDIGVIFTGGSDLTSTLPLTQAGDAVAVTYIESGEAVVPMMAFENRSLQLSGTIPPPRPARR
ncbi:MAG TPA: hypothetical protein VL500_05100 [Candidatus Eisenbacteria bacterium]|nr:hypothetical protein [Candidatus Eisenbacteria bacterium]